MLGKSWLYLRFIEFYSMEAFEFVMKHATDGRVSKDQFLEAYGFTKPK